ncbi:hypothetical protein GG496_001107 [Candidatus Fervidibacteria bacterium JGI MDM2 JNZ-1-D12]
MILSPTATFAGKGEWGFGAFYMLDKTARAPQGVAGHHYLYFGSSYSLSHQTNLWVYHNRVLGRYEDEHLQMSGFLLKQKVTKNLAVGILAQWGNQSGEEIFAAARLPIIKAKESKNENEHEETRWSATLDLHVGVMWARWRGEWEGEEWVPYTGLTWQPAKGWVVTVEIRERQKDFLKPSWMVSIQRQLNRQWQLIIGLSQSGLSDKPHPFIGLGLGIAGVTR